MTDGNVFGFTIHPYPLASGNDRRYYARVFIHPNETRMRAWLREKKARPSRTTLACVFGGSESRWHFADVHFCQGHLTLENIAHEAYHAAVKFAFATTAPHVMVEDTVAYPTGIMTAQILYGFALHGFLERELKVRHRGRRRPMDLRVIGVAA